MSEGNKKETPSDLGLDANFLDITPKHNPEKNRFDKLYSISSNNF